MRVHKVIYSSLEHLEGASSDGMTVLERRRFRCEIIQRRSGIGDRPVSMPHIVECEIPFIFIGVEIQEFIGLVKSTPDPRDGAVETRFAVLLQDDVDDPMIALGIIFSRRIGHDLDALDLVRRDLVKSQLRTFAIQEDGGRAITQTDVPGGVDAERRYLAKGVLGRSTLTGEAIAYIEDLLVYLRLQQAPGPYYGHRLHLNRQRLQLDDTHADRDTRRPVTARDGLGERLIANDADLKFRNSLRQTAKGKAPIGFAHYFRRDCRIFVEQKDCCGVNRLFGLAVYDLPRKGGFVLGHAEQWEEGDKCRKKKRTYSDSATVSRCHILHVKGLVKGIGRKIKSISF